MTRALRSRREAAGMTQAKLARAAGVSRPLVSAVEAGRHQPGVATALALAGVLGTSVEELFGESPTHAAPVVGPLPEGAALRVGRVDDLLVYAALADEGAGAQLFSAPDGRLEDGAVQIFPGVDPRGLVVAGCDPALGLMADLLPGRGAQRLVPVHATTREALAALEAGRCHAAVVHGRAADLESDLSVERLPLPRWRVGLAHAASLDLDLEALSRGRQSVAQRDAGASAQRTLLRALPGAEPKLRGPVANGHLDAARRAALGTVDAALSMEPAARAYGLAFTPLEEHRVELWVSRRFREHAGREGLGGLLASGAFRARLAGLGYETGSRDAAPSL